MKCLIVYATKYGTTEKAVNLLKAKLGGEVTLVNIAKEVLLVIVVTSGYLFHKSQLHHRTMSSVRDATKTKMSFQEIIRSLFFCRKLEQENKTTMSKYRNIR